MADRLYPSPTVDIVAKALGKTHEIFDGLRIGSMYHCPMAEAQGYTSVSVRHIPCGKENCVHRHYLDLSTWKASAEGLDAFSEEVSRLWLKEGRKVFVHCAHGIERAPLAVAYFAKLHFTKGETFEDVYEFVRRMRPMAQDRTLWLSPEARGRVGI